MSSDKATTSAAVTAHIKKLAWENLTKSQLNQKLMHACINRDIRLAKEAILQGANVNHRTSHGMTPLLAAAEHGDVDLIILICTQPKSPINLQEKTIHGSTPLHLSVFYGHREVMLELLRRGALVNCSDTLGRYPLHFAATQKDVGSARMLIKFGARVNVYDAFSDSPLSISVLRRPCVAMARLLLANRASSDPPPDGLGMGLLLEAVLSARLTSNFEAIKVLIWARGDVNIVDPIGLRTPLHLVAINGQLELAEYLISHGADLYAKNRAGQTPLEVAFNCRNLSVAYLIEESRNMQSRSRMNRILESTEGPDMPMRNREQR